MNSIDLSKTDQKTFNEAKKSNYLFEYYVNKKDIFAETKKTVWVLNPKTSERYVVYYLLDGGMIVWNKNTKMLFQQAQDGVDFIRNLN